MEMNKKTEIGWIMSAIRERMYYLEFGVDNDNKEQILYNIQSIKNLLEQIEKTETKN